MIGAQQVRGSAPVLMVKDVRRAHAYYAEKLGFRSPRMWGAPPTFCIAQRDSFDLMLAQVDPGKEVHPNAENEGRIDAYFWVREVDALHEEFSGVGADIICAPEDQDYGMRELLVRDPDGHVLCFGQDISGRG
jgi:uncharacterized glyoxalase superfamily protein PhnB